MTLHKLIQRSNVVNDRYVKYVGQLESFLLDGVVEDEAVADSAMTTVISQAASLKALLASRRGCHGQGVDQGLKRGFLEVQRGLFVHAEKE